MISLPAHAIPHTDVPLSDSFDHLLDFTTFSSLRRMAAHQQSKPLIRHRDFIRQVLPHLPEVAAFLDEDDFGIVHLEIGAMKLATRAAFARCDFATVRKHLALIADLFDRADGELYDAIRISYLEAIFIGETSAAHIVARGMLPSSMENALRQAELLLEKRRYVAAE